MTGNRGAGGGRPVRRVRGGLVALATALVLALLQGCAGNSMSEEQALREAARSGGMVGPRLATRPQLQQMRDSLQTRLSAADNGESRDLVRARIRGIERRLEEGDIGSRDVVRLTVQGEERWSGNFSVGPDRRIELPGIDPVSLEGLLYSELEGHMREVFATYLREPRVRAQALKRVAVLGEVGSPGFYTLEGEVLVSEAIMEAGGPTGRAKLQDTRIRRMARDLDIGEEHIVSQSLSLDRLGVQSGDEVYVPRQRDMSIRNIAWGLGIIGSVLALGSRIF